MIASFTSKATFLEWLDFEFQFPFTGWDFAHINDRFVSSALPWSYASTALKIMRTLKPQALLDMGTGGGEFLTQNFQPFPPKTCVTEAYPPNITLARQRLAPLSVDVYPITSDRPLPFEDNAFDIILNRHESYAPKSMPQSYSPKSKSPSRHMNPGAKLCPPLS